MKNKNTSHPGSSIKQVSVVVPGNGCAQLLIQGEMGIYLMSLDEVRSALSLCSFSVVDPIVPGLPILVTNLKGEK